MVFILLILRPQPGADASAARAAAMGLKTLVAPLFAVKPLDWRAPPVESVDAVLLTSANAARHGGRELDSLLQLPCYAVGEATAEAARQTGFREVLTGPSDGAAALAMMAADGIAGALHLCGRDHLALHHPEIALDRRTVYAAEAVDALPDRAVEAIRSGAAAIVHSPRAGATLAALLERSAVDRSRTMLLAISAAAASAAGRGWREVHVAPRPRDQALLELAAKLCKTGGGDTGNGA